MKKISATAKILVNIDVENLGRAIKFYSDGLGLKSDLRLGPTIQQMRGAASPIFLLEKPSGSRAAPPSHKRTYRRHWTPVHLDFVVKDLAKAVKKAVAAGAKLEAAPKTHNWGQTAMLSDPFGHGFCLIQFSKRGYAELIPARKKK